jgi:hypothetical protein
MWQDITKKWSKKLKKIKIFPRVLLRDTRGRDPSPSARKKVLGEEAPSSSVGARHSGVGGYPKNSDNCPNTSGVLNTFRYKIRAQRDCEALCK